MTRRRPLSVPKVFAYSKGKLGNSNYSQWENFNSEANGEKTLAGKGWGGDGEVMTPS